MKAECETFNLKRELQWLDIDDAQRHESLPEVRRGGKRVDLELLEPRREDS